MDTRKLTARVKRAQPSPYFAEPEQRAEKVQEAIEHLRAARNALWCAGAGKSLARTRLALTSAQGALRNASRRQYRDV